MGAPYTLKKLTDVSDAAPKFGVDEIQEARFAGGELDAAQTGVSYHCVKPGKRQGFAHRHENAEEVYVVLRGSGRVKLDDEILDIDTLDAIRVSPPVMRSFEAGPDGLDVLAFGPHHENDGEIVQDWWTG